MNPENEMKSLLLVNLIKLREPDKRIRIAFKGIFLVKNAKLYSFILVAFPIQNINIPIKEIFRQNKNIKVKSL